jgi:protein-L-isoaspartate(D-aspartate) O-methyltransferase
VLDAIRTVPRHLFVDDAIASRAYEDTALPIGLGQTISQPLVVARMTELLLAGTTPKRVLEIGTGSGYQAAVLAALVEKVFSLERIDSLLVKTRRRFVRLGLNNIKARHGDGRLGWPEEAPFDGIIVTAAAEAIAPAWTAQLAVGARLVAPVGPQGGSQRLVVIERTADGEVRREVDAVSFVPILPGVTT